MRAVLDVTINELKGQHEAALAEVEAEKVKLSEALAARETQITHLQREVADS